MTRTHKLINLIGIGLPFIGLQSPCTSSGDTASARPRSPCSSSVTS